MSYNDDHKVESPEDIRKKQDSVLGDIEESDETFVMVGLSRITCSHPVEIFGSNIRNSNTIELTVRRAERRRSHGRWDYYARERLIRVEMTPVQFAQMITSMNVGDGVPCSLREFDHKQYEYKYGKNMGDTVETDMDKEFIELYDRCKLAEHQIQSVLKRPGRISAVEKEEISNNIFHLIQDVRKNIPFMEKQFRKTMDEAVLEGKREIQAYFEGIINQIGVKGLQQLGSTPKPPQLMIGNQDEESSDQSGG